MRSSTNNSSRRSRTAVPRANPRAWSRSHLAFVATVIAVCCVAECDAGCLIPPDSNGTVIMGADPIITALATKYKKCYVNPSVVVQPPTDTATTLLNAGLKASVAFIGNLW